MIKNFQLTYASAQSPWYSRDISSNQYVNSLIVAVLVTIISYQATALLYDVLLGMKERKVARVSALHSVLLLWKASPLAVMNNVLRQDWLTKTYYRGDIPDSTKIVRDINRIRPIVTIRLTALLAIAPVINAISVAFTLGRTKILTFSEAGFKGVAIGVNEDFRVLPLEKESSFCWKYDVNSREEDILLFSIKRCVNDYDPEYTDVHHEIIPEKYRNASSIWVSSSLNSISMQVYGNKFSRSRLLDTTLHIQGEKITLINNTLSNELVENVVRRGLEPLARACGYAGANEAKEVIFDNNNASSSHPFLKLNARAHRIISCPSLKNEVVVLNSVLDKIENSFTLVSAQGLVSLETAEHKPFHFGRVAMLRRKGANLSCFPLLILALVLIFLRLASLSFLSNDHLEGIDFFIKKRLGIIPCEPMIHDSTTVIHFEKSFQLHENGHYGLCKGDLPDVERLIGGYVG